MCRMRCLKVKLKLCYMEDWKECLRDWVGWQLDCSKLYFSKNDNKNMTTCEICERELEIFLSLIWGVHNYISIWNYCITKPCILNFTVSCVTFMLPAVYMGSIFEAKGSAGLSWKTSSSTHFSMVFECQLILRYSEIILTSRNILVHGYELSIYLLK